MSKKEKSKEVLKGLKELSVKDLQVKSAKLKDDIFWLQFKNRSGQTISVGDLQKNKKMLAQVETLISQDRLGQKAAQKSTKAGVKK